MCPTRSNGPETLLSTSINNNNCNPLLLLILTEWPENQESLDLILRKQSMFSSENYSVHAASEVK